ncbi:MAG: aminotransferase class IV [Gemmatimonadales bacterium]|nr:aminotransferase class IV [Gemmatimonadales bacterium]
MRTTPRLIETIRIRGGKAPLWHLHLRRMSESARDLGVPIPPEMEVPTGTGDRVRRLEIGVDGVTSGDRPVGRTDPVQLITVKTPFVPYPHKTVERAQFDRATMEVSAVGADDALFLSGQGFLCEATVWSVFWWERDRVGAPDFSLGVLHSVSRLRIEELMGPVVPKRAVLAEVLLNGLFLANAARGVVPVASVDGRKVTPARRTEELARRFWPA